MEIPRELVRFWWLMDVIENKKKIHIVDVKGEEYKPLTFNSVGNLNKQRINLRKEVPVNETIR